MRRFVLLFVSTIAITVALAGVALAEPVGEAEPNDSIAQAQDIDRYFDLSNNAGIDNSTTVPHATITQRSVYPSDASSYDYYSFTVPQAGVSTTGVFDIDNTSSYWDSYLRLYDESGNLLSENDDSSSLDPGSGRTIQDSYLQYTFQRAGTYYIKVSKFLDSPISHQGLFYDLNVSIPNHSEIVAPTVAISSPEPGGILSGTTNVSANASDNRGVSGVQFELDGSDLGGEDTEAPTRCPGIRPPAPTGTTR